MALATADVGEKLERFARLFQERHFPLYAPFIEFFADEGEGPALHLAAPGHPLPADGFGYDGLHEMWDGYREGLSALALLAQPPDACYGEPGGLRTAWLECAAQRIPQETLERIPKAASRWKTWQKPSRNGLRGCGPGCRLGAGRNRQLLPRPLL